MTDDTRRTDPKDHGTILPKGPVTNARQVQAQSAFEGFCGEQDLEAFRCEDGKLRLYRVTGPNAWPNGAENSWIVTEREYTQSLRQDGSLDEAKFRNRAALTQDMQPGKITHVHVREFESHEKPKGHFGHASRQQDEQKRYDGGGGQVRLTSVPEGKLTTHRTDTPECHAMGRDAQKRQAAISDQQLQIRRLKARSEEQSLTRQRADSATQSPTQSRSAAKSPPRSPKK